MNVASALALGLRELPGPCKANRLDEPGIGRSSERELIGSLLLVSGRTRVAVGEFLAPEERRTLAQALKSALAIPRI